MIFHIFADTDHGNKEIIKKESELIEKIVKEERSKNKDIKICFFTEIFRTNELNLIYSVLKDGDWNGDPREVYKSIINVTKKNNIPLHPIAPKNTVMGEIRNKNLFAHFRYSYNKESPEISLIDIGRAHSDYFVKELQKDLYLKKEENKIYLHTLISSHLGCEDKIKIIDF